MRVKKVKAPDDVDVTFTLTQKEYDFLTKHADVYNYYLDGDKSIVEMCIPEDAANVHQIIKDFLQALYKNNEDSE